MKGAFKLRTGPDVLAFRWNFHLACLSYWAYHATPTLDTSIVQACGLDNFVYHTSPAERVPGWIRGFDGVGYQVAFAGTVDVQQLLAYVMQFGLEPATGINGRTFTPFNAWSDILTEIVAADIDATKRITLTGHSLGGAMAIIVGEKLKARGRQVQCAVTYGCPRIGDETFATSALGRVANIRRLLDVIPSVPPAAYVRKSNGPFSLPRLPPLFRPGFDFVLGNDFRFAPNASALVPQLAPGGWIELIDTALVQRHLIGNYVIQLWDYLDRDSRAANKDLYLVMRDGFGLPLPPTVPA